MMIETFTREAAMEKKADRKRQTIYRKIVAKAQRVTKDKVLSFKTSSPYSTHREIEITMYELKPAK